jgi:glycosyltransferase involved in cell wall biosynthesis
MLNIIAVTYNHNESLKCFINSIKSQTNPNWKLFIIHDGPNQSLKDELLNENYLTDNIDFIEHPFRTQNYGHLLRKWSLENLDLVGKVLLTNADNYYTPNLVEEVLKYDEDFIYFNVVHSHHNKTNHNKSSYGFMNVLLQESKIDMGCVVIKSEIAKIVGFNSISYGADWDYFEDVLKTNPSILKIDKVLFVHN